MNESFSMKLITRICMECLTYNVRNYYQDRQQICQLLINMSILKAFLKFSYIVQYLNIIVYKLVKQKLKIVIDIYTFKEYDLIKNSIINFYY